MFDILLCRVQITPKTSTNITRYLYCRGPVRQVFSQRASDKFDSSYEKKFCSHGNMESNNYITSNNHRLESAGLNALEELLRCWECTEKIVKPACVF